MLENARCLTYNLGEVPLALWKDTFDKSDLRIINVSTTDATTGVINPRITKLILFVGSRAYINDRAVSAEMPARDFLTTPSDSEELSDALLQCALAQFRNRNHHSRQKSSTDWLQLPSSLKMGKISGRSKSNAPVSLGEAAKPGAIKTRTSHLRAGNPRCNGPFSCCDVNRLSRAHVS